MVNAESSKKYNVPIHKKVCLSIEEAAAYFGIGENRLRDIVKENKHEEFVLWIGNQVRIKRKEFKKYIATLNYI